MAKGFKTVSLQDELLEKLKWELEGFGLNNNAARVRFVVQQFLLKKRKLDSKEE
tara:strand:+ start:4600 stop:4761 length:162 start_codon:yes stop_codon:yes gene_type:complete